MTKTTAATVEQLDQQFDALLAKVTEAIRAEAQEGRSYQCSVFDFEARAAIAAYAQARHMTPDERLVLVSTEIGRAASEIPTEWRDFQDEGRAAIRVMDADTGYFAMLDGRRRRSAPQGVRTCRICGCWDLDACVTASAGPCWWVEPDRCSHCPAETAE